MGGRGCFICACGWGGGWVGGGGGTDRICSSSPIHPAFMFLPSPPSPLLIPSPPPPPPTHSLQVVVGKEFITIVGDGSTQEEVMARVRQIKNLVANTEADYEREKLNERVARLSGGVAVIQVGGWGWREWEGTRARAHSHTRTRARPHTRPHTHTHTHTHGRWAPRPRRS